MGIKIAEFMQNNLVNKKYEFVIPDEKKKKKTFQQFFLFRPRLWYACLATFSYYSTVHSSFPEEKNRKETFHITQNFSGENYFPFQEPRPIPRNPFPSIRKTVPSLSLKTFR